MGLENIIKRSPESPEIIIDPESLVEVIDSHGLIEDWKNGKLDDLTVILGGGAQQGILQGTLAYVATKLHLPPPKNTIGSSVGGYVATFWATEQQEALDAFELVAKNGMIGLHHIFSPESGTRRGIVDTHGIAHKLFKEERPIDLAALRNSPMRVMIALTDEEATDDKQKFIHLNQHPLPYDVLEASTAMRYISTSGKVAVDGSHFTDGAESIPIPLRYAIDELGSKNVLIVLADVVHQGIFRKIMTHIKAGVAYNFPDGPTKNYFLHSQRHSSVVNRVLEEAKLQEKPEVRLAMIGFKTRPKGFGAACTHIPTLQAIKEAGIQFFTRLFATSPQEQQLQAAS